MFDEKLSSTTEYQQDHSGLTNDRRTHNLYMQTSH
jgi:hypothetical protein